MNSKKKHGQSLSNGKFITQEKILVVWWAAEAVIEILCPKLIMTKVDKAQLKIKEGTILMKLNYIT